MNKKREKFPFRKCVKLRFKGTLLKLDWGKSVIPVNGEIKRPVEAKIKIVNSRHSILFGAISGE